MTPLTLRRRFKDDGGFAMILVLGFTGVLAALITVGTAIGIRTLQSSRAHVNFENALAVAETGIDGTLAKINSDFNATPPSNFVTAGACAVTAPGPFTDVETERSWARSALTALPDSCLKTLPNGQYVAVRPTNVRAVYSMAWVPSRATAGAKKRLVKAEYLFAPYKPTNAVLTQGALNFSGSVAITTIGSSPSDVHSNTTVGGYNGSTSIAGGLSSSGTLTGGGCPGTVCTAAAPVQGIANISARRYWDTLRLSYSASWFELCPNGVMRSVSPAAAATPARAPSSRPRTGGSTPWSPASRRGRCHAAPASRTASTTCTRAMGYSETTETAA